MGESSPLSPLPNLGWEVSKNRNLRHHDVAYASSGARFDLGAYVGGEGAASLRPSESDGRIGSDKAALSWSGKFEVVGKEAGRYEAGSDKEGWDLIVPQLAVVPPRWMCFSMPMEYRLFTGTFTSPVDDGRNETIECSRVPSLWMRSWGTAHPFAWVRLTGIFGFDKGGLGESRGQSMLVSGTWIKMGRLGVLGPPLPKTFFVFHLSKAAASRIGVPETTIRFNFLPRALACSSFVRFPRWEARLLSRHLVATVTVDLTSSDPYQFELPDPEEAGVFVAHFPYPKVEIALETKSKGSWKHAATVRAICAAVEFGGREPVGYLALLPKEQAFGMD